MIWTRGSLKLSKRLLMQGRLSGRPSTAPIVSAVVEDVESADHKGNTQRKPVPPQHEEKVDGALAKALAETKSTAEKEQVKKCRKLIF